MAVYADRVQFTTATTGTGSITVGPATTTYRLPAAAGIVNTNTVRLLIQDGNAWEISTGVASSTATVFTRVLTASSTGSLLSLSGSAVVSIIAASADLGDATNLVAGTLPDARLSTNVPLRNAHILPTTDNTYTLGSGPGAGTLLAWANIATRKVSFYSSNGFFNVLTITGAAASSDKTLSIATGDANRAITLDADFTVSNLLTASGRASTANIRTGTSTTQAVAPAELWGAVGFVGLTDAATIALDMSTFINGSVTLGGNRTLGNPSNTKTGQSGVIYITQDGTGSRTLSYSANWKFQSATAPTLSTVAGRTDMLVYFVVGSSTIAAVLIKDVR